MQRFLTIVRGGYNVIDSDPLSLRDAGKLRSSALHRQVLPQNLNEGNGQYSYGTRYPFLCVFPELFRHTDTNSVHWSCT